MKTTLKTTLFTTLLISSALTASYDPFTVSTGPVKKSKYAVTVAPIAPVVVNPAEKTIAQHKIDGAPGFHILAANEVAGPTDDLTGAHTHFTKAHVQALVNAEETAKNLVQDQLAAVNTQVTSLLELIAELKATHGSTVASAALTHDGTLKGMLDGAKLGAGNITLADSSVVDVAAATNAQLEAILTGGNTDDREVLLAAFRSAPAWTADASEEADLMKTIFLRNVINR